MNHQQSSAKENCELEAKQRCEIKPFDHCLCCILANVPDIEYFFQKSLDHDWFQNGCHVMSVADKKIEWVQEVFPYIVSRMAHSL